MKKIFSIVLCGLALAAVASAHVTVKPDQVGVAKFQVFTMSVPVEKDIPTTALKLALPDGLNFVTPTVKAGWKVEVKTTPTGKKVMDDDGVEVDEMKPTEINWTGGSVPAGFRDEFTFSAQVPASATSLPWKAYQTYSDGSVVAWDQTPGSDAKSPYSVTQVINDLAATPDDTGAAAPTASSKENIAFVLSIVAIVLAIGTMARRK